MEIFDPRQLLRAHGLRETPHRRAVLLALRRGDNPPSADELQRALAATGMNRVTLYRILESLCACGIIERLSSADRAYRYHLKGEPGEPHAHFYCKSCGQMECLNREGSGLDLAKLGLSPAQVDKIEIRLDGTCGNCLKDAGKA